MRDNANSSTVLIDHKKKGRHTAVQQGACITAALLPKKHKTWFQLFSAAAKMLQSTTIMC
jgi:hypothetical protein